MPATKLSELKAISNEAREILQALRGRPRFDLSTRQGWLDLQVATCSEEMSKYLSEDLVIRLRCLCVKWQRAYHDLRFLASTRPVWNS